MPAEDFIVAISQGPHKLKGFSKEVPLMQAGWWDGLPEERQEQAGLVPHQSASLTHQGIVYRHDSHQHGDKDSTARDFQSANFSRVSRSFA